MIKHILIIVIGLAALCICAPPAAAIVEVFEANGSSSGFTPWNHPTNIAEYNAWLTAVGETPDFREDWDSTDWKGDAWVDGQIFDIQNVPTAIFTDGLTFGNIGARADRRANANDSIGSTDAIDNFGWYAHESGISTVDLSQNGADYLGFYIFDTDHGAVVTYILTFTDDSQFIYPALATEEDRYRFVGFINRNPSVSIKRLEITADDATRYGIDEFEWGRTSRVTPEPASLLLLATGILGLAISRNLDKLSKVC